MSWNLFPKRVPLIPKDISFFAMFAEMSNNLIAGASVLVDLFADYREVSGKIKEIRRIEHVGDDLTHSILTKLNQTFITPFDREDIHKLASSLDDVLDLINSAGARIAMYKITHPPPAAAELARIILLQSQELAKAVPLLQKNGDVLLHCVEINRLENEADQVSRQAIGELFEHEKDPINLIKIKELIEVLETATDRAEDAADVLETVALKNA
jgi:predicted phosphate transport protein (TIGR00153 family)